MRVAGRAVRRKGSQGGRERVRVGVHGEEVEFGLYCGSRNILAAGDRPVILKRLALAASPGCGLWASCSNMTVPENTVPRHTRVSGVFRQLSLV